MRLRSLRSHAGIWIPCKKINASSFLASTIFRAQYRLPLAQRGLCAIAHLLVTFISNNVTDTQWLMCLCRPEVYERSHSQIRWWWVKCYMIANEIWNLKPVQRKTKTDLKWQELTQTDLNWPILDPQQVCFRHPIMLLQFETWGRRPDVALLTPPVKIGWGWTKFPHRY